MQGDYGETSVDIGAEGDKIAGIYKQLIDEVQQSVATRFVPEKFSPTNITILREFPTRNAIKCQISSEDQPLVMFALSVAGNKGQTLFVEGYGSPIIGKGLGTAFYTMLEQFAREQGFQAIAGGNGDDNIDFFIDKLGRHRLSELSPEKRHELIGEDIQEADFFTYKLLS